MDISLKDLEVLRQQFTMTINRRFPTLTIIKIVELSPGAFAALVQSGETAAPFLIGARHGHLVPVKTSVLREAEERYKNALNDVRGALDVLHAYEPKDPAKWTNMLNLLNSDLPTSD